MSWLGALWRALWRFIVSLFHWRRPVVTVSATATLTSTGNLAAPQLGDVLTYTVVVTGQTSRTASISVGTYTDNGVNVPISGGPWTWTINDAEQFTAPVVTGTSLTKPFTQTADPHVWTATV